MLQRAWPLLETVLEAATQEPRRVAVRNRFFKPLGVSEVIVAGLNRARASAHRRALRRAAGELTALDAFAIWTGTTAQQNRRAMQHIDFADGHILRTLWRIEAWEHCHTGADLAERALINVLLLRETPAVAMEVAAYLRKLADEAAGAGDHVTSFRLHVGSMLCRRNPSKSQLENVAARFPREAGEIRSRELPRAQAARTAITSAKAYVVCLNRLADVNRGQRVKRFDKKEFKFKKELATYLSSRTCLTEPGAPTQPKHLNWQVGLDRVGVVEATNKPAVHSFLLTQPREIKRRKNRGATREWDQNLHDFLKRDVTTVKLAAIIIWHEYAKTIAEARKWLSATDGPQPSLEEFKQEIQQGVAGQASGNSLIHFLEDQLARAIRLEGGPRSARFGKLEGWCRAVNRHTLGKEIQSKRMVWPPGRRGVTVNSKLCFRSEYNYILVDEK